MLRIFALIIIAFSLTACQNMSKQDVGTVTGAVAGGLIGSTVGDGSGQLLATAAGSLIGAYMGGSIGRSMDLQDRQRVVKALENNQVGEPTYWRNRQTGAHYKVTPVKNITRRGNKYCREYRTAAEIDGKTQRIYGTACRQPDGSWKVVK